MVSRYISPDLGPTLRLKALLGYKWTWLRPEEHPLGAGRAAFDKYVAGIVGLTHSEKVAMSRLKRWAATIDKCERHWSTSQGTFVKDLLTATQCRSLVFEIEVITACIDPNVQVWEWPIYRSGERDISTVDPAMLLECKLTKDPSIGRVLKLTSQANKQPRPDRVPFAVAVGFDRVLDSSDRATLYGEVQNNAHWFQNRPELSAVLVLMESLEPPVEEWNPLGFSGGIAYAGEVIEVRNAAASNPLPDTFSYGGREGVQRLQRQRSGAVM